VWFWLLQLLRVRKERGAESRETVGFYVPGSVDRSNKRGMNSAKNSVKKCESNRNETSVRRDERQRTLWTQRDETQSGPSERQESTGDATADATARASRHRASVSRVYIFRVRRYTHGRTRMYRTRGDSRA
jgi:hypothetical protein